MVDLLIKNGKTEREAPVEIAVTGGKIEAVAAHLPAVNAEQILDLHGQSYVTPGWIDDHVHCYEKLTLYYDDPDLDGYTTGVTTVIDAGSTGADNIRDFYTRTRDKETNVYALINVSKTGILAQNELDDMARVQQEPLVQALRDLPDFIVGIKARESHSVVLDNGIQPLLAAKRFQSLFHGLLPVMVHIGNNPPDLRDVLGAMTSGDILTHAYNGKPNGILDLHGRIKAFVREAYDRGVIFDVGHGTDSFNFRTGEIARDAGLVPRSLSTDIYSRNRTHGPVYDMATTMEKMLLIGYTLPEVIRMVTYGPAANFHLRNKGRLLPGCDGDLTIFKLTKGTKILVDSDGNKRTAERLIKPTHAIVAGRVHKLEVNEFG
ncbi:MAG: amidohydrolase/deacetylase family metallohydrolase [Sporolactobacillus sp.]|jgi:dihydroorotase|nr:amidohydrolase/deacetylase family metallohydrolase [Sporolactobacillus sp.]